MTKRKKTLVDALRIRFAVAGGRSSGRGRSMRPTRMTMLAMGAALSIGGVTEAFNDVQFTVQKDLDHVQVVRKNSAGKKVVANVRGEFAANSVYKLARFVPDRFVSQEQRLFDFGLFSFGKRENEGKRKEGLTFLSSKVREEFFDSMPFGSLIDAKAKKYDVDPFLVAAVVEAESRFRSTAQSPVGAKGLMQLMPRTGAWMGARNLYDPEQNVDAGVKYLKYLEKRFDGNLNHQIAAYNAGEGNVMKYGGVPPYRETRGYVKTVLKNYDKRQKQAREFNGIAERMNSVSR